MRTAPARPSSSLSNKPVARPAPPRPAPRQRPMEAPARPVDVHAPTVLPATLPPPPGRAGAVDVHAPTVLPPTLPPPPGKAGPADRTLEPDARRNANDATLKPLASVKAKPDPTPQEDTHEVLNPPPLPKAPTGTLLGLAAQEIAGAMHPASEKERDSGRRTTQPLGLPDLAREAKPLEFDDRPTEIGAPAMSIDDGPTRPQERLDEDPEEAPTKARQLPKPRPNERMTTTPAMGIPERKPTPAMGIPERKPTPAMGVPVRKPTPASLPLRPSATAPVNAHAPAAVNPHAPTMASMLETKPTPLPAELPPPPRVSNDAGAFPQLDLQPTPAMPTLALPPMPASPISGSPIEAVKYLLPLGKAIWARKRAQDSIRALLHGDQRLLDSVLRDLGRVAREEQLSVPALADEMRRMKEQEERKGAAESALAEAESAAKKEDERWHIDKGERASDLARRDAELKVTDEDLRARAEERRGHDSDRAKVDLQIRAAEKRAAAADAKANKADNTPPEKGGGPNTAANARTEAAEARKEATALIPARDEARAKAEALDAPIAVLTQKITDERAGLVQKRRELTEAEAAHLAAVKQLEVDRQRAGDEKDAAERELTQRFVTAGTILNLNRVEHPRLVPLFARVDELKNGVNAREAAIVRLESERRLYDRAVVQKGLLTVGIALAVVVLFAIILIVILAR